ncbi:MAG TPA: DNA ligase D [Candidatus Dormibacteraeota bacterium]|nr:DNA ligase D [Candidatus Dormibacteraeota bacterium]
MSLAKYKSKRNLAKTPEPAGGKASGKALRFVVQKHEATRLHYDLRLEIDGVLKSWAVPKGPSLDPDVRHLAMKVEDHPMDYRGFEGVIPEGNYGAGTVMVWDEGTYADYEASPRKEAEKNVKAGLHKGDLKFVLHGKKLNGAFVLVKTGYAKDSWLLIKKDDKYAAKKDVTKQDKSAKSGKSMEQLAKAGSKRQSSNSNKDSKDNNDRNKKAEKLNIKAPKAEQPSDFAPMLATLADKPFDDKDWLYEIKWDGYRILAHIANGTVRLLSRNGRDYTQVFAPAAEELAALPDCILDGEMVVVDQNGRSDFGRLQNYQKTGEGTLRYFVFDAPYANGRDLRELPLTSRRQVAAKLIKGLKVVQYSDHIAAKGVEFFQAAAKNRLEGIIAKQADSPYLIGRRSRSWLKIKTHQRQEAVIGGYTEPKGSRKSLGALVLGVYEGDKLKYIGHTGGGLTQEQLDELHKKLKPLERKNSPFDTKFKTNAAVHWLKPQLVCEVNFAEWTAEGIMRQPIFVGLREDKDAKEVVREVATADSSDEVKLTHLDKIYFPKDKLTKGDVINYYKQMSGNILPYLKDRPMSLNRHPDGITKEGFYQKDIDHPPNWAKTHDVQSESAGKEINYLVCTDERALLYMAQLGCIEMNPWLSRVPKADYPDFCVIDLDPEDIPFTEVVRTAQEVHKLLDQIGAVNYCKTSGATGLHVYVPLAGKYTYEQSKQFAHLIAAIVNKRLPDTTSLERMPKKRQKRVYLDYLQNRKGQTLACAYSLRPRDGAPVATPLEWSEVTDKLDVSAFNIKTIQKRLAKKGDLWQPLLKHKGIDLKKALGKLEKL